MNEQTVMDLAAKSLIVLMKVASPALIAIMLTGLIVSIFQAATQINEQTLSFIPKIFAMTFAILATGPWILQVIIIFTKGLFNSIPTLTQ